MDIDGALYRERYLRQLHNQTQRTALEELKDRFGKLEKELGSELAEVRYDVKRLLRATLPPDASRISAGHN